jgi:hypothetical protein
MTASANKNETAIADQRRLVFIDVRARIFTMI